MPQTRASVHVLTNCPVVPLISFSEFNTIILLSFSYWLFNGNISPFLIKPSLITPSWPSLPCFPPPFSRGSIMKLISDEETFWSVSFYSRSIIPSSKWWKVCSADRDATTPPNHHRHYPSSLSVRIYCFSRIEMLNGWAVRALRGIHLQCSSALQQVFAPSGGRCFHTDCLRGTEPRCHMYHSCSAARNLLTMMSSQLVSPQRDHSVMALPKSKPLVATGSERFGFID